jgi:hypothetical protein
VVWDLRRPSALPARRSELGHAHPVYALALRDDAPAAAAAAGFASSGLVTASTDGMVCEWSLDQLLKPATAAVLRFASASASAPKGLGLGGGLGRSHEVPAAVSALSLVRGAQALASSGSDGSGSGGAASQPWYALVGAESGDLCLAPLQAFDGVAGAAAGAASAGQPPWQRACAHYGMVTAAKAHPHGRPLALSAGADWTTRLWCSRALSVFCLLFLAPARSFCLAACSSSLSVCLSLALTVVGISLARWWLQVGGSPRASAPLQARAAGAVGGTGGCLWPRR